jgi:arginase
VTLALIRVPYDAGQREQRLGAGPDALARAGAADALGAGGLDVIPARIETDLPFATETTVGFELAGKLGGEVARACRSGATPVVLAGNCLTAVGVLAGLTEIPRLGLVWLDAHGDLNTPETSPTGYLDGMALAVATGRCWTGPTRRIPGFAPVADGHVAHLGARALDPGERTILDAGTMAHLDGASWAAEGGDARASEIVHALAGRVDALHLHLDLDVQDPALAGGCSDAVPGGPGPDQVQRFIAGLAQTAPLAAVSIAGYAPDRDRSATGARAALGALRAVGHAIAARR